MLRLKTTFATLGLVAAGLLWASVSYAAPFSLGNSFDGGGPGATAPGSRWFTDFDTFACDITVSGESINEAHLDPDNETAVGIQPDAFDDGLQLVVNGFAFNDPDDTGDLVTDAGGQAVKLGPEAIAGLDVTLEWKALSSTATMRTFATLQNTTAADIAVPISWQTNLGSDAGTTSIGSSSGDSTFGVNDRWLITSDDAMSDGDPVNSTVLFGPGSPDITPSSVADLLTGCAGEEGVVVGYSVTVPAGQSRHLLFFNQMNQTNAEALAASTAFDTNPALDSEFLSGIGAQLPDILNWDFQVIGPTPTAAPPETPTSTPAPVSTPTASATPPGSTFTVLTPTPSPAVRAAALPPTGDSTPAGDGQLVLGLVIFGVATLSLAAVCLVTATRRRVRK